MTRLVSAAFALLFAATAVGCSDDSDVTAPPTDRITVAPESPSMALTAGSTATVSITITRPVGYTGPITLTAENLPDGVSGSFSPATLPADVTASVLSLSAAGNATSGSKVMTVRAEGSGLDPQTATITVDVGTGGGATGSFTIALSPGAITLPRGGSSTATVAIARSGGFTGEVALLVSGFPAGVQASVTPGSTTSTSASVFVTADPTVPGGTYFGVVTAAATGLGAQTASLSITVLPSLRQ